MFSEYTVRACVRRNATEKRKKDKTGQVQKQHISAIQNTSELSKKLI